MPDELPPPAFEDEDEVDAGVDDAAAVAASVSRDRWLGWLKRWGAPVVVIGLALWLSKLAVSNFFPPPPPSNPGLANAAKLGEDLSKTKYIYDLPNVIVNLSGDRSRRYLKTSIHLEVKSKSIRDKLSLPYNQVRVKDAINTLLSSKSLEDVEGLDNRTRLRREIRDDLNLKLGLRDGIVSVYFSEFMIQ
ncbi:MAG: flagellar basal body-associated FliL family protein [Alphaproteobacteria bacterium]